MEKDENNICPVCGGTGQVSFFQGVSRFLLTTEECPECAGMGYKMDPENDQKEKLGAAGETSLVTSETARETATILVVDDNPAMRGLLIETLGILGYKVFVAANGEEALELSRIKEEKIDLLLVDIVMPGMSGRQLLKKLQSERPDLKAILMSGYPADVVGPNSLLEPHLNFISKPFTHTSLNQKIIQVLEESSPTADDN